MKRSRLIRKTPLCRKTRLRQKSSRLRVEEKIYYNVTRPEYLAEHPFCEGLCGKKATDVHHRAGREGKLLNDKRHYAAVCRTLHDWIRDHPNQAREAGLLYEVNTVTGKVSRR